MDEPSRVRETRRMIGFVAGTGGPEALSEILAGLPGEFAVPILVLVGMPEILLQPFATRLAERCLLNVTVAEDGQVPEPGKVYVAGGFPYLLLVRGHLRFEPSGRECQAKNVLFRSMARDLGPGAIAVILTGMGPDGAEGMKEVREAGGYTIIQNEVTSVVYGTTSAAFKIGAACESLPIQEIAPRLVTLVEPGPEEEENPGTWTASRMPRHPGGGD